MRTISTPSRSTPLLLTLAFIVLACSRAVAAEPEASIRVGVPYGEALRRLTTAGIKESAPLQLRPVNPDVALKFFRIEEGVMLLISRSQSTDSVRGLSITYIPRSRATRDQTISVGVRAIEFKADKSYVVHFEAPTE